MDFNKFINDPMAKKVVKQTQDNKNDASINRYEMFLKVERIKKFGDDMGFDGK